jgi:hypothetical protein
MVRRSTIQSFRSAATEDLEDQSVLEPLQMMGVMLDEYFLRFSQPRESLQGNS